VPRASDSRELLAPRDDVWSFVAEPYHFSDWWPGIAGVRPDRRGFAAGARWQVQGADRPTLFRRATSSGLLLVRAVEPPHRFAWTLTASRIDAELRLDAAGERTIATLDVSAPWLVGFSRSLPRRALTRLHALCQTAAEP
jgi:uncharacterized protein YndB with AHSA1/START domain